MDYQNGKIYRLVCNASGKQYVGSTTQPLSKRLSYHKSDYQKWKKGRHDYYTAFEIIEDGNYDIVLIENYPCCSKEELHARERYYIENTECVNKNIPTRTSKEYRQDNHEKFQAYMKKYRQDNQDHIKEQKQEYMKHYQQDNKDHIQQYQQTYYQEQIQGKKVMCECGVKVVRNALSTHRKSQKHLRNMKK